ncbi:MAG: Holliday junction branch migration protein RuvA [Bacteroidales bacterium]|nr:Holliday junction branch migration protein RuvA [Bacteroidales bacterium]
MYEYISGEIVEVSPSFVIVETGGIGYFINISLTTYEKINKQKNGKLYIYQVLREDSNAFFGFYEKSERDVFRHLISVSGIGANTARLMLSSLKPNEIINAITEGDVSTIKSVKGIGLKTAQRVIVDLKDKIGKADGSDTLPFTNVSPVVEEALSALVMLGFNKKNAEKVIQKITSTNKNVSVEELVKQGIKNMSN